MGGGEKKAWVIKKGPLRKSWYRRGGVTNKIYIFRKTGKKPS